MRHIDKQNRDIPIVTQAKLLGISRASVYYHPAPVNPYDLQLMHRIDELFTDMPYYGVMRITSQLRRERHKVNEKRIRRLMRNMGLVALYPKPHLSRNDIPHPVFPYLLRGVPIVRPNQVWGTDITYIRMKQGYLYLVAFLDWYSRYVLSWRLSTLLTAEFVIEAAKEALAVGIPEITNSDQGVQFTSADYLTMWNPETTRISMDGRGRAMDNIFTERLWRSVKYEEVYLKNYDSVLDAKDGLTNYFDTYNNRRLHQALKYQTPAEVYFSKKGMDLNPTVLVS